MIRTGKTKIAIEELAHNLIKEKTVFVYGLKQPDEYINRLKEVFNINVELIPKYIEPSENNRFHFKQNTVIEYLPEIVGYEFKIIDKYDYRK